MTGVVVILDPFVVIACFLVGVGAGFMAGYVGLGGGVLVSPLVAIVLDARGVDSTLAVPAAVATSVASTIPVSLSAAYRHMRQGTWHPKSVLPLGLSAAVVSACVARVAIEFVGDAFTVAFASVLLVVAAVMTMSSSADGGEPRPVNATTWLVGGGAGAVGALGGVGGGLVFVPYLAMGLRVPTRMIAGTSAAAIVFNAAAATVMYVAKGPQGPGLQYSVGFVNVALLVPILAGSVPSAQLFARLGQASRPGVYRVIVACVLVASSLRMFAKVAGLF